MQQIKQVEPYSIRYALKFALRQARVAKDTSNRELYLVARDWIQKNLHKRNTGVKVYVQSLAGVKRYGHFTVSKAG